MPDRSNCIPVLPGGECPACGWRYNDPAFTEPHPVLPHGGPKAVVVGKCANCGSPWNLDDVRCSACKFLPVSGEMQDALKAEKDRVRRTQFLPPLAVRPMQMTSTADAAPRRTNAGRPQQ